MLSVNEPMIIRNPVGRIVPTVQYAAVRERVKLYHVICLISTI